MLVYYLASSFQVAGKRLKNCLENVKRFLVIEIVCSHGISDEVYNLAIHGDDIVRSLEQGVRRREQKVLVESGGQHLNQLAFRVSLRCKLAFEQMHSVDLRQNVKYLGVFSLVEKRESVVHRLAHV